MSTTYLKHDLEALRHDLFLEENEDTWDKIAKAMKSLTQICDKYNAYEGAPEEVVSALRSYHRPIISALGSDRTRLSGTAIDTVSTVAAGLGPEFEPLVSVFFPPLLALGARTSKVVVNRARSTIFAIIEATQVVAVLSFLVQNAKDKSASLRMIVAEATLACLNSCNPPDLERESRAREVESIIQMLARDANADVRKVVRKVFESYKILLPHRLDTFTAPMTPTMRKYLDLKNVPSLTSSTTSRTKLDFQQVSKPSTSNSNSTSTAGGPRAHALPRSGSSTVVPSTSTTTTTSARNLATTLTRVSRPAAAAAAPVSRSHHQPTRVVSESQAQRPAAPSRSTTAPAATATTADTADPRPVMPPLRSQRSVITRGASANQGTTSVPHRIVLQTDPAMASTTSGPRRVPVPAPPTAAAAAAPEVPKERDLPKRVPVMPPPPVPPAAAAAERPQSSRSDTRDAERQRRTGATPTLELSQSTRSEAKGKEREKEERQGEKPRQRERVAEPTVASRTVVKSSSSVAAAPAPSKRQTTMPPPPAPMKKTASVTSDRRPITSKAGAPPPAQPAAIVAKVKPSSVVKSSSQLAGSGSTRAVAPPSTSSTSTLVGAGKPKVVSSSQSTIVTGRVTAKPTINTKSTSNAATTHTTTTLKGSKAPTAPTKPTWGARNNTATTGGHGGGLTKPTATSSQRTVTGSGPAAAAKVITKKPSTIRRVASTIAKVKTAAAAVQVQVQRPVTPAAVALPPSPEPTVEDLTPAADDAAGGGIQEAGLAKEVDESHEEMRVAVGGGQSEVESPADDASAVPVVEGSDPLEDVLVDVPAAPVTASLSDSTVGVDRSRNALPLSGGAASGDTDIGNVVEEDSEEVPAPGGTPSTPTAPVVQLEGEEEPSSSRQGQAQAQPEEQEQQQEQPKPKPPFRQVFFSTYTEPKEPVTPGAPNPYLAAELAMNGKTPISALLFSIERGFSYTPSAPPSPLSPPEKYANGPPPPSEPRVPGPMLPFNHALHTPSMTFGNPNLKRERQLDHTQINVVGIDSTRLFNMTNLALEEPIRPTYTDMQS